VQKPPQAKGGKARDFGIGLFAPALFHVQQLLPKGIFPLFLASLKFICRADWRNLQESLNMTMLETLIKAEVFVSRAVSGSRSLIIH
jgi:hypothetical protein